jgi:hypothetical protein
MSNLFTTPPMITSGSIQLFGKDGKEIHNIKKIVFHPCGSMEDTCVHDIDIIYGAGSCLHISNVKYEDLVSRHYILYLTKSNKKTLDISIPKCRLVQLPIVK